MNDTRKLIKDLNSITELREGYVDTKQEPSQEIKDMYQHIYDLFHSILTYLENDFTKRKKMVKENNQDRDSLNKFVISSVGSDDNYSFYQKRIRLINEMLQVLDKKIVIGGGCLSEQFIEGYASSYKDIDFFLDSQLISLIVQNEADWNTGLDANAELKIILSKFGFTAIEREIDEKDMLASEEDSDYLENRDIECVFNGIVNGTSVDLVFINEMALDFDLSFREFFYNGNTIFSTEAALEDIKEKKITVKSLTTPFSTYYRLMEFSKRYSLPVDSFTQTVLLKQIHHLYKEEPEQIKIRLDKVKKYNDKNESYRLSKEIPSLVLTPLEKTLFSGIEFMTDMFYKYRNRFRFLLEQEQKGIHYNFKTSIRLPELDTQQINGMNTLSSSAESVLFEEIKIKNEEVKVRSIFDADTIALYNKCLENLASTYMKVNSAGRIDNTLISDINLTIILNTVILKKSREENPNYTVDDFKSDHFAQTWFEHDKFYWAFVADNVYLNLKVQNLFFSTISHSVDISYLPDREKDFGMFPMLSLSANDLTNEMTLKHSANGYQNFLFKEREEALKNILDAEFSPTVVKRLSTMDIRSGNIKAIPLSSSAFEKFEELLVESFKELSQLCEEFRIKKNLSSLLNSSEEPDDDLPF